MNGLITTVPTILSILVRTSVIYLFVLAGIRLSGKRELGQMSPFDLVLILLISNSVQNAMVGQDTTLLGGLIAAATLFLLNRTVGRLALRHRTISELVRGHARLLINRGIVVKANLEREEIPLEDLMQALREHGVATVEDVRLAVLEVDGSISVLKNEDVSSEVHKPHRRFRFHKIN